VVVVVRYGLRLVFVLVVVLCACGFAGQGFKIAQAGGLEFDDAKEVQGGALKEAGRLVVWKS